MRVSIYIIGWQGYNDRAVQIASQLAQKFSDVTVVTSGEVKNPPSDQPLGSDALGNSYRVIIVPNHYMYGRKLAECLKCFSSDLFFLIHADAFCEDWSELVNAALESYNRISDLGVWVPLIDFTPWHLRRVEKCRIDSRYSAVIQTDGIVFCWSFQIAVGVRSLPLFNNNSGWEIDTASVGFAKQSGKLVLIDRSCQVSHPRGTGYSTDTAHSERLFFLRSLPIELYMTHVEIQEFVRARDRELGDPQIVELYKAAGNLSESALQRYLEIANGGQDQMSNYYYVEQIILQGIYKNFDFFNKLAEDKGKDKSRIFVYGTGAHTSVLFSVFPWLYKAIDFFLDSYREGLFLGKSCFNPRDFEFHTNDSVIISAYSTQAQMMEELRGRKCRIYCLHD